MELSMDEGNQFVAETQTPEGAETWKSNWMSSLPDRPTGLLEPSLVAPTSVEDWSYVTGRC